MTKQVIQYGVVDADGDLFERGSFGAVEGLTVPVTMDFDVTRPVGRAVLHETDEGITADLDLAEGIGEPFTVGAGYFLGPDDARHHIIRGATMRQLGVVNEEIRHA